MAENKSDRRDRLKGTGMIRRIVCIAVALLLIAVLLLSAFGGRNVLAQDAELFGGGCCQTAELPNSSAIRILAHTYLFMPISK